MQIYRISPEQFLENYSGTGASYKDGARWNSAGLPVLYFALSPSTALLEMSNYIPSPRLVPPSYRLGIYNLPDTVSLDELEVSTLPSNWADFPYPLSTQQIGSKWLKDCKKLALIVPSTAVPAGLEKIIIVNPSHSEIKKLTLTKKIKDLFNKRTFQGI